MNVIFMQNHFTR